MNKPLRSNVPMVKRNATIPSSKLPISSISALRLQHAKSFGSTQSEDITDNLVFVCIISIVISVLVLYCVYSVVLSHLQSKTKRAYYHRKNRRVPTSASINSSNVEQDQKTIDEDEDISQIFSFEEEIISDVATFRRR
jgi:hypothetical protein